MAAIASEKQLMLAGEPYFAAILSRRPSAAVPARCQNVNHPGDKDPHAYQTALPGPAGKLVVLGLVTTKRAALEDKDMLKRRIEEAAQFVDVEQLCLSPQCGFSSTEEGNKLTIDDQRAKLELIVELADEVWG